MFTSSQQGMSVLLRGYSPSFFLISSHAQMKSLAMDSEHSCSYGLIFFFGAAILFYFAVGLVLDVWTFLRPPPRLCCSHDDRDSWAMTTGATAGIGAVMLLYLAISLAINARSILPASSPALHCVHDAKLPWAFVTGLISSISITRALKVAKEFPVSDRCNSCATKWWKPREARLIQHASQVGARSAVKAKTVRWAV
jgi:hypothetical protein